ncbi:DUF1707 SHOCT-like domain-containing protein [Nocardioides sp. URHA0020]|uniref:DUF1707 SHOCT-like domain-containing protein n=1 Tax=Nocardioides sp. URHA0020 TaxID=1380392 RepID=UPI0018CC2F0B|nr:DUF1707 domain-containing protein [Nocardioides sp. URHA0020]
MSTPEQRARDQDRDAAISLVEAAWADGQIIEADRDKRVQELQRAHTLAEIDLLTRGLQATTPTYRTESVPVEPEEPVQPVDVVPPPPVPYGPATTSLADVSTSSVAGTARPSKALYVIPLVVVLLVVGVASVGVFLAVAGGGSDDQTAVAEPAGQVLTDEGYDDLVAAVEDEIGSTSVFDAVLYPSYAVVSLPVDATSSRESSYYWDGDDLRANNSKSTSSDPRFDLTLVDGAVLVDLVDQVRQLVDEPSTWYTIVRAPSADRAMVWAYASNEYGETAYLGATRDGTVVYDSTKH